MNFYGAIVDVFGLVTFLVSLVFLIGGAVYMIHFHGWSPWWLLAAALLIPSVKTKTTTT